MTKPLSAPTIEDQPNALAPGFRTYKSPRLVERHANILTVTREALAERSFSAVTMNELARRAGVTKKTLYNVYGNKDKLLVAAVSEVISLYRRPDGECEPGITTLIASRKGAIEQVLAQPAYANAMTSTLVQLDGKHRLVDMLINDSVGFTKTQLQADIEAGHIQPGYRAGPLAKQLVSQGWGINLLLQKETVTLSEFGLLSLTGMLLILKGVSLGIRQEQINEQLDEAQKLYQP